MIAADYSEEMPTGVQTLLQSLTSCDTSKIKIVGTLGIVDNEARFDKKAIKAGNPGIGNDVLNKRVQFFNQFHSSKKNGLTLESHKEYYALLLDEHATRQAMPHPIVDLSKNRANIYDEKPEVKPTLRAEPTVFISHKWHKDQGLRDIFSDFTDMLDTYLSNPSHDKPSVKLFYSTSQQHGFKPDSDRQTQQDSWCEQAQTGLILWCKQYDYSKACKCELEYFVNPKGINQSGKKAIVLLDHGQHKDMPPHLAARNTFFHPADNEISLVEFWSKATFSDKDNYISALAVRIYDSLQASNNSEARVENSISKSHKTELSEQVLRAGFSQSVETFEEEGTQKPEAFGDEEQDYQRIDLVSTLTDWANDFGPNSTRVSVLLGDFGFGKTVSCRLLNKELSNDYEADPANALLPLYLDLKALQADITEHKSKPIEHLLETMLQQTGEKLTVTGEEVVYHIRNNPCLVIFDGFDEIGHHLNESEQQSVYSSLLNIIPASIYREDAARLNDKKDCVPDAHNFPSKLLISCRTHFFNRISEEESFLSGNGRHALGSKGTGLKNIRRSYMAPFSSQTVEKYLCEVLGEDEGLRAKEMLSEIHDLSELSSHPIMLDLVTQQLPRLQEQQKMGKIINSAVLYLNLFEKIGERDKGKHKIRLSDKQELLAELAMHLWRGNQTSISYKNLDSA